jgi:hypothetical protein
LITKEIPVLYWKVFASIAIGTVLGAYVEPKLTSMLPASVQGPGVSKAVHAGIAGGVGTGVFWAVNKAVKS